MTESEPTDDAESPTRISGPLAAAIRRTLRALSLDSAARQRLQALGTLALHYGEAMDAAELRGAVAAQEALEKLGPKLLSTLDQMGVAARPSNGEGTHDQSGDTAKLYELITRDRSRRNGPSRVHPAATGTDA